MQVHFIGLDFDGWHGEFYGHAEDEHVTLDLPAPPAKGTRIIFNGGTTYVVSHEPEFFINTGTVAWNDEQHGDKEAWVEAAWVLVSKEHSPAEEAKFFHRAADPREGMDDAERERFDKQMTRMIAEIRKELDKPVICPQCGRHCRDVTWRQDDCAPRGASHCYKSSQQISVLREMARGC